MKSLLISIFSWGFNPTLLGFQPHTFGVSTPYFWGFNPILLGFQPHESPSIMGLKPQQRSLRQRTKTCSRQDGLFRGVETPRSPVWTPKGLAVLFLRVCHEGIGSYAKHYRAEKVLYSVWTLYWINLLVDYNQDIAWALRLVQRKKEANLLYVAT
jgi:hypothetical protein